MRRERFQHVVVVVRQLRLRLVRGYRRVVHLTRFKLSLEIPQTDRDELEYLLRKLDLARVNLNYRLHLHVLLTRNLQNNQVIVVHVLRQLFLQLWLFVRRLPCFVNDLIRFHLEADVDIREARVNHLCHDILRLPVVHV